MNEILPRVEFTNNLLKADLFLTWNSVLREDVRNLELAKEYGKPSVVLNHGLMAENDHNPNIADYVTNMCGNPMVADKYLSFGEHGRQILLDAGVPKEKTAVVGCPIVWEDNYAYTNNGKAVIFKSYAGQAIKDPKTGLTWDLTEERHIPVKYIGGERIAYFPNHSMHYKDRTKEVYEQIKDMRGLCIKATHAYHDMNGPFKELLEQKFEDRVSKIIFPDIQHPHNLELVKGLIARSKVVVTDIQSTLCLLAYSMGVHVVIPKYDWKVRNKNDEIVYPSTYADVLCEPDKIRETIEAILEGKIDKRAEMQKAAIEMAGIDLGSPTVNIMRELENLVKK